MRYDYAVKRCQDSGLGRPLTKNEKLKRIWQVIMIERDDTGSPAKTFRYKELA
jgi:hypothetical protein